MVVSTVLRLVQRCKKPDVVGHAAGALMFLALPASVDAQDPAPPSPIEHAIVEYLCRTVQRPAMIGTEAYQACYSSQLTTLREPFGRDLARLTAADRKSLDARCGEMQAAGRDAYLACLHGQLMSLRDRRARGKPAETSIAPDAPPAVDRATSPDPPAPPAAAAPAASNVVWWVAGAIAIVAGAGGAGFVFLRGRPSGHRCHGCGAAVDGAGDLCGNCRHEAAAARRRAAAERAEEERAEQERAAREQECRDEEQRHEMARREEERRLREEYEQRAREEHERRLARVADDSASAGTDSVVDPHAVLGVAADATAEDVRAAYERAMAKYDPREYEHLGHELQEHFRAKAAAVERAYQQLAGN